MSLIGFLTLEGDRGAAFNQINGFYLFICTKFLFVSL